MIITVEYDSEVLGKGVFWEGEPINIPQIRNTLARSLARRVAIDGITRSSGMWTASIKCPYPIPGDDGTVKDCVRKGHCGCGEGKG